MSDEQSSYDGSEILMAKKRNYRREYDEYQGTPEQIKRRAERNKARREAVKAGRAKKGDGKEVDHLGSHRTGSLENVPTKVVSKSANRRRQPSRGGK